MAAYRVLSLDGGGIRGLFTAVLIQRIQAEHPGFLEGIDLHVGTSTGGIIALGLAKGMAPAELVELYRDRGPHVFDDSIWDNIVDLGKLMGADYSNKRLKAELKKRFGTTTLAKLPRRVLIPAFDLDNEAKPPKVRTMAPKFFHNFPGSDSDGKESCVDVGLATSAAPTYFPSYDGYVDGGVVANNPSMAAIAQVLDPRAGTDRDLKDIVLLSLGTGHNPTFIKGKTLDWGYAQWAKPLLSLIIDGVMGVADFQCRQLLEGRYHRLDPILPRRIDMDEVKRIPELVQFAERVDLGPTLEWVKRNFG
jgi:patatin-like phospholipase/acyl hydrolase